jgi:uncharacterized protein
MVMKIAIISDIHDNHHNLKQFYEKAKELKAERIICLGDFINPGIIKFLAKSEIPVFSIWGNNDGEKCLIMRVALEKDSNLTISDKIYDFLEVDGKKIFLTHYGDIAESMARSGDYVAVFHGHTHDKSKEKIGNCLLLNPGELSTHKTGIASFAIYDTETNDADIIEIENPLITKWK